MQSAGYERFLVAQSEGKVHFKLALVVLVVPQSDVLVLVRHREEDWSLEAGVHLSDLSRVEAISDQFVANRGYLLLLKLASLHRFVLLLLALLTETSSFLLRIHDRLMLLQLHVDVISLILLVNLFEHVDQEDVTVCKLH